MSEDEILRIRFPARLVKVEKGDKAPKVQLEITGELATHVAGSLMDYCPGSVFIELEPAQLAIVVPDEPGEGQFDIAEMVDAISLPDEPDTEDKADAAAEAEDPPMYAAEVCVLIDKARASGSGSYTLKDKAKVTLLLADSAAEVVVTKCDDPLVATAVADAVFRKLRVDEYDGPTSGEDGKTHSFAGVLVSEDAE